MRAIRDTWTSWEISLAAVVLICVNAAAAQSNYRVTDLGALHDGVLGCAMGLNNKGWTESMDGFLDKSGNFVGRAVINVDGLKIDLGTLGGRDSWINWGGINERGEAVGLVETSVPDPNGEDICGFGTGLTCRPFLWQEGEMKALPTLGGNNGQASAINSRGQIAGAAENTTPDSTCINTSEVFQMKPVIWSHGAPQELPTISGDPDGFVVGINDLGQAVGGTGSCGIEFGPGLHAALWENGTAVELPNLGSSTFGNAAFALNNRGRIVGWVSSADGKTFYAALWDNGTVTNLRTLPGDFAAYATGINNKGEIVGSTLDSNFNDSHAFIWKNGAMTDLNTLFPANSNLYATMANKINSRGEISGMATVLSGPDAGKIHAFLATPVDASIGESVAAVARTHLRSAQPANIRTQLLHRFGLARFGQITAFAQNR